MSRPTSHDIARASWIGRRASARWAYPHDLSDVRAEGKVVGYSATPMVLIETDDGEQLWWSAELTKLVPQEAPTGSQGAEQPTDGGSDVRGGEGL